MIEWIRDNKLTVMKWAMGLVVLAYLWSIIFKLFIGQSTDVYLTMPWFVFEAMGTGDPSITKKLWLSGGFTFVCLVGLMINGIRQNYLTQLHGDAHWATEHEIQKAGLRAEEGILLGRTGWVSPRYLVAGGVENIAVYAPPRSGKGVGFVIPNNLNWNGSIITLDVRGEAYTETSGFRSQYSDVYILDFLNKDGHTHCYNPLSLVDRHNKVTRYSEIDKITTKLWPPELDKGDIWQPEARTLFNALALMLIDLEFPRFTIGEINRLILDAKDFVENLENIVEEHQDTLDPISIRGINGFLQKATKEQSGVLSSMKAGLSLWMNPIIDAATSQSDFDIRELRKKRISIYISVKPADIARLGKLIALFFEQVIEEMTQEKPDPAAEPHKLLLLPDEFTLLPRMTIVEKGVAFLSGYNVITMPVIQAVSQLESTYGRAESRTFLQSFKYRIVYAQNDGESAERISRDLGTKTVRSWSFSHRDGSGSGGSVNKSYMKRPLMYPQDIMKLNKKKEIVMVEAESPIQANKIVYYKDSNFKARLLPAAQKPQIDLAAFIESTQRPAHVGRTHSEGSTETIANDDIDELVDNFFDR